MANPILNKGDRVKVSHVARSRGIFKRYDLGRQGTVTSQTKPGSDTCHVLWDGRKSAIAVNIKFVTRIEG